MNEMLSNRILNRLPAADFTQLVPLLEPISLTPGERLAEQGESSPFVYFPENAIISCHADMQDGKSAEVGMVGKDGVAGLPALFGSRAAVHSLTVAISGSALRMRKEMLEQKLKNGKGNGLQQILDPYVNNYVTQVAQRAACAILHRMEQRFAVWLLMILDRLDTDLVEITQERIAQHLGVRRAGVTVIAREMQYIGAISYTRGHLRVINRELLQRVACECYAALSSQPCQSFTSQKANVTVNAGAFRPEHEILTARAARRA